MKGQDLPMTTRRASPLVLLVVSLAGACEAAPERDGGLGIDATPSVDVGIDVGEVADGSAGIDGGSADATAAPDAGADAEGVDASVGADAGVGPERPIGWASVAGLDVASTTGGGELEPEIVRTADALQAALRGTTPRVIEVDGAITGDFSVGSNLTLQGGPGARITGSLTLTSSVNVVVRDLTIVGWNCADTTDCGDGLDAIVVRNGAHHLWFHHLDVSDGSDGNLDIVSASDFVTVSWTHFHYSRERAPDTGLPHRFSNLIGNSDAATDDRGRLRVTLHHCWWGEGVDQRTPRVRFGQVHVFNSLYTMTGNTHAVTAGFDARLLVEHNAFVRVRTPIRVSEESAETALETRGNLFVETTGSLAEDRNAPAFAPPYSYVLDPTDVVEARVRAGVGPRR
jgi:pectate lyase